MFADLSRLLLLLLERLLSLLLLSLERFLLEILGERGLLEAFLLLLDGERDLERDLRDGDLGIFIFKKTTRNTEIMRMRLWAVF